jgi:hypothetical protein
MCTRARSREWSRAGHDVVVVCQEPNPELYDLGGGRRALGPDLTSFDTGDVADIHAKLDRLLALPPNERDTLKQRVRRVTEERWSWAHVADRLLEPFT